MTPRASNPPTHEHDRRVFLRRASAAALGLGWTAGGSLPLALAEGQLGKQTSPASVVRVRIDAPANPLVNRAFTILRDRIQERCSAKVVTGRIGARIVLTVDPRLPADAFRIDQAGKAVRVAGGSPRGLIYGVGKFLRTSSYTASTAAAGDGGSGPGTFDPSAWRGTSKPHGSLRGMYFASHFHNWYHQASETEIARYMEDLALWGVNAVMVIFPMINLQGWDDPQAEPAVIMVRQYARAAHALGLQFATGINNTMFIGAPKNIRAKPLPDPTGRRGNSGHPICPSNPEGHAYIMDNARKLFEKLSDVGLDILCHWPYDEGGCACDHCLPWGSNGYLKISRDLTRLGQTHFPKLKTVLSTWMFDTPPEGEWQGLTDAIARGERWIDYILADAHEDFPRYPLDSGVPGKLPLLNFPEISMWGNWPWGGFGANPLPGRVQRLWDQVKHAVQGGFPYSEGIYEDLNKAAVLQFYWDPERPAKATLEEYIAYEFGPGVSGDVLAMIDLLENAASATYQRKPVQPDGAQRAWDLAERIHARLPEWGRKGWRWEILRLRALLDRERFGGAGLESPAAQAAMLRLMEIYHCQMETDDPYHHRVRPPLKRAVDRAGKG